MSIDCDTQCVNILKYVRIPTEWCAMINFAGCRICSLFLISFCMKLKNYSDRDSQETIMVIGNRLKELRESKQLSQGDIEKRSGLLRCYISRVENGHTVPSVETLEKMARSLE